MIINDMTIVSRITYFLNDFASFLIVSLITIPGFIIVAIKIYKSHRKAEKKKLFLAVSTIGLSLIFIFVTFEAYFRYVYDVPDGLGFLNVSKKWNERHVVYNNYFYRDRNFEGEKQEGVTRIGVMGDSITYGGGIENPNDRFSNILEKNLRDAGYHVEVYNLGRPGYDTEQEISEFEKVRHLNFDILIWQYFLNDIQPNIKSTGTRIIETNRNTSKIVSFLSDKSYFFDFIYWRLSNKYSKTIRQLWAADIAQYSNEPLFEKHKNNIGNFISSLKGQSTQVLVIIFPSVFLLGPNYPAAHIHEMTTEVFKSNGVEVLDLLSDFQKLNKKELMASKFDPHPNEYVHNIAAEKLYEKIIPILDQLPNDQ